ncbi:MAG TPA: TauD/TfdA family dioxygenase, partial [Ilumatobacteraceae bacterium]
LSSAVGSCHTAVTLEPGDLLVVDNSVAVHGRSPFTPRFDGTDRWLQRTFVVSDLAPSAGDRVGRIIATRFAG